MRPTSRTDQRQGPDIALPLAEREQIVEWGRGVEENCPQINFVSNEDEEGKDQVLLPNPR